MTLLVNLSISFVVAYNIMCAVALTLTPSTVDARFRPISGDVDPTRAFFMHSIAAFHVYAAVLSLSSVWMPYGIRSWIGGLNALLNFYDAASQHLYWGTRVWTSVDQWSVDVGFPLVVAIISTIWVFFF